MAQRLLGHRQNLTHSSLLFELLEDAHVGDIVTRYFLILFEFFDFKF